ncbi:benzylsuccinate synthase gamma subunit family protein [Desulfosporosinus sp. BICA1-9]|uniref:benzylsuccinate synthase gamma subunit family protein n=1 Tax=Desulfosporosinus sp. BICA1-9 TaxID=1531958 RepID=UPI00054B4D08|nr:benzylsuccinate synthase gamma subunit family protein [Desulfosporosinus sp. BICA1-9]KJS88028.1 MAG: benzylsuccinate synthase [Desulfosporosinus sp. BICA1-9]HBW35852.1 benzylsuccinate synthase subunit gamma [Desulfosporosinus sp.]
MAICAECKSFFSVPDNADDYEPGKGDCVIEEKDEKGKYWLSKSTMDKEHCEKFKSKKV